MEEVGSKAVMEEVRQAGAGKEAGAGETVAEREVAAEREAAAAATVNIRAPIRTRGSHIHRRSTRCTSRDRPASLAASAPPPPQALQLVGSVLLRLWQPPPQAKPASYACPTAGAFLVSSAPRRWTRVSTAPAHAYPSSARRSPADRAREGEFKENRSTTTLGDRGP